MGLNLEDVESNIPLFLMEALVKTATSMDSSLLILIDSPRGGRVWLGLGDLKDDFLNHRLQLGPNDTEYVVNPAAVPTLVRQTPPAEQECQRHLLLQQQRMQRDNVERISKKLLGGVKSRSSGGGGAGAVPEAVAESEAARRRLENGDAGSRRLVGVKRVKYHERRSSGDERRKMARRSIQTLESGFGKADPRSHDDVDHESNEKSNSKSEISEHEGFRRRIKITPGSKGIQIGAGSNLNPRMESPTPPPTSPPPPPLSADVLLRFDEAKSMDLVGVLDSGSLVYRALSRLCYDFAGDWARRCPVPGHKGKEVNAHFSSRFDEWMSELCGGTEPHPQIRSLIRAMAMKNFGCQRFRIMKRLGGGGKGKGVEKGRTR